VILPGHWDDDPVTALALRDERDDASLWRSRLGMAGLSRGGPMTYLALAHTKGISAAVVGAGPADLTREGESRPEMEEVYRDLIPGYTRDKDAQLARRSAALLARTIAQGRAPPAPSRNSRQACGSPVDPRDGPSSPRAPRPYRLVMFEGADHSMSECQEELWALTRSWLERFVRQAAAPDGAARTLAGRPLARGLTLADAKSLGVLDLA